MGDTCSTPLRGAREDDLCRCSRTPMSKSWIYNPDSTDVVLSCGFLLATEAWRLGY